VKRVEVATMVAQVYLTPPGFWRYAKYQNITGVSLHQRPINKNVTARKRFFTENVITIGNYVSHSFSAGAKKRGK